jgi:hypothetical protein
LQVDQSFTGAHRGRLHLYVRRGEYAYVYCVILNKIRKEIRELLEIL